MKMQLDMHQGIWMDLSRVLAKDNRWRKAAKVADRAVSAPFNFHWSEKFQTLSRAGSLRLNLRDSNDLNIAVKYFSEAEQMWRNNSRLDKNEVSSVLYNIACLHALKDKNSTESAIYLLEASALQPNIAKQALGDSDLSILRLAEQELPSNQEKQFFSNIDISVDHIRTLLQKQELSINVLLRYLSFLAKSS
jgi:hypothetical protein